MDGKIILLAALVMCTVATPLWSKSAIRETFTKLEKSEEYYRLPEIFEPLKYNIELIPYFEIPESKNFTFDGKVLIEFQVKEETNLIQLHAYDMIIDEDAIKIKNSKGISLVIKLKEGLIEGDDRHFYNITTVANLLPTDVYTMSFEYVGKLNDDLEGFYRSQYTDVNGEKKWMGVTQFERVGARRAFPCFDEPLYKAKFALKIAHAPEHRVLSNMPDDGTQEPLNDPELPNWTWTVFPESSVRMSTYLVAFTVSEFQSIEHPDATDPTFRLWARPGLQEQGHIANNLAPKIVDYMERYTGHQYSLPKIDQVAIPDFNSGAMENWGLITYRESRLLYEDGVSTSSTRQSIEAVVAHELAHQWFGNIVSPTWWKHIWLNEGFATYYEYHSLLPFEETWQLEEQFVYQEMYSVFQTDSLTSTHPMLTDVGSPASASAAFDNIAYNKGGCIIRFMNYLMGHEHFQTGIGEYLTKMEFQNAEPDDLWSSLATHVPPGTLPRDVEFAVVMNSWNNQAGYPVISVTRNYEQRSMKVSQSRFLTLPEEGVEYPETWWVALTFTDENKPDFEDTNLNIQWLHDTDVTIDNTVEKEKWILFNPKQTGYYRVNYDDNNWALLTKALESENMHVIHVINRGQIMDDALALARAGILNYPTALDTTNYLKQETEYTPWASALFALSYIWDRLNFETAYRSPFESYMLGQLDTAYDLVNGFTVTEDDSHIMLYKRSLILKWTCELRDPTCNDEANALFKSWQQQENSWDTINPINPDLKSVVYCAGIREGGQVEFDFLFERYEYAADNVPSERDVIITALGCASDTQLLESYLEESIAENSRIRSQDARSVHTAVYSNYLGVQLALDFVLENWERCQEVYHGPNNLGRSITGVAEKCNTPEQRNQLQTFLDETPELDPALQNTVKGAINTVDESLGWHEAHRSTVVDYLAAKSSAVSVLKAHFYIFVILLCTLKLLK